MKWALRIFMAASILAGVVIGFVFGVSRSGLSANPIEIEVIDSKENSQGATTAIRRYGNYGGGFLYTESRIEIVIKQANQECVAYSREVGGQENLKYDWSSDSVLTVRDNLNSNSVVVLRRCFAVRMHIADINEYEKN